MDPHYAFPVYKDTAASSSVGIEYWLYTVSFTSTIQIYRLSLSQGKLSPLLGYLSILWSGIS